jgi:NADPH:quinone reductase-like Zn-dependent oxidoreductase
MLLAERWWYLHLPFSRLRSSNWKISPLNNLLVAITSISTKAMGFRYNCVLLVGATSGIGAAMADKLVEEGARVIAVGRRQDRLDAFVKKHGPERASSVRFDVSDHAGLDAFVNQ